MLVFQMFFLISKFKQKFQFFKISHPGRGPHVHWGRPSLFFPFFPFWGVSGPPPLWPSLGLPGPMDFEIANPCSPISTAFLILRMHFCLFFSWFLRLRIHFCLFFHILCHCTPVLLVCPMIFETTNPLCLFSCVLKKNWRKPLEGERLTP